MERIAMRVAAVLFVLFSAFLICNTAGAADWVLYDNFSADTINPSKWFGQEYSAAPTIEENKRMIEKNTLHLLTRFYGQTGSNNGYSDGSNRLRFLNPKPIYGIKATFKVKDISTEDCPSNPQTSWGRARISGYFFNTGTPTPGSSLNDVHAQVGLQPNQAKGLEAIARVILCTDAACNTSTLIGSEILGSTKWNKKTTLSVEWDKDNNRFIFQQDKQAPVYINYTVSDSSEPGSTNKRLDVSGGGANCISNPRPFVFIDAYYDDVYVKSTAALPDSAEE
jgi:hypothetical protein